VTVRIAMWSGPRNISTAMMRSWEARGDCFVSDEPLYGYYLAATGLEHPMGGAVMASLPNRWQDATQAMLAERPEPVWYQKHMTHHLLGEVDRGWLSGLRHAFLIRDPRAVAASYVQRRGTVTAGDLGFLQQADLFEYVTGALGQMPVVIDAADVLRDPAGTLSALCEALGVPWTDRMLSWPAGRRDTDGVWASHWYDRVEASTDFAPYAPRESEVPDWLESVVDAITPAYERLALHKL